MARLRRCDSGRTRYNLGLWVEPVNATRFDPSAATSPIMRMSVVQCPRGGTLHTPTDREAAHPREVLADPPPVATARDVLAIACRHRSAAGCRPVPGPCALPPPRCTPDPDPALPHRRPWRPP